MIDLVVCLLLLLGISACVAEVYFVVAYTHSDFGEYPPFFPSFGRMKKVCLSEARKILAESKKVLKIIDLGCGSGSLIIPLAKEFPQHEFYGYDWDVVAAYKMGNMDIGSNHSVIARLYRGALVW